MRPVRVNTPGSTTTGLGLHAMDTGSAARMTARGRCLPARSRPLHFARAESHRFSRTRWQAVLASLCTVVPYRIAGQAPIIPPKGSARIGADRYADFRLSGRSTPCRSRRTQRGAYAAFLAEVVLLIAVTARLVSLLLVAFSWSRISLRSLCASSWPRSFAHSRSEPYRAIS